MGKGVYIYYGKRGTSLSWEKGYKYVMGKSASPMGKQYMYTVGKGASICNMQKDKYKLSLEKDIISLSERLGTINQNL